VTLSDMGSTYLWRHPDGTWHRFAEGQMPPVVPAFSSKRRRTYSRHAVSHSPVQIAWPVGGLRAFLLTQAAAMDWRCPYCLDSLRATDGRPAFTAEHIVPLSRGGRHAPLNVGSGLLPLQRREGQSAALGVAQPAALVEPRLADRYRGTMVTERAGPPHIACADRPLRLMPDPER
jgi:hypothetical protein